MDREGGTDLVCLQRVGHESWSLLCELLKPPNTGAGGALGMLCSPRSTNTSSEVQRSTARVTWELPQKASLGVSLDPEFSLLGTDAMEKLEHTHTLKYTDVHRNPSFHGETSE